jgi:antitoxin YefM
MTIQVTYTNARARLAKLCDEVANNREVVVITRRGAADVALIAEDELASLIETAHLFRSRKNARRLLAAYDRAMKNAGEGGDPGALRQELGIEPGS